MATHHLQTPFTDEVIRQLHAGDVIYFDGTLFGDTIIYGIGGLQF